MNTNDNSFFDEEKITNSANKVLKLLYEEKLKHTEMLTILGITQQDIMVKMFPTKPLGVVRDLLDMQKSTILNILSKEGWQ